MFREMVGQFEHLHSGGHISQWNVSYFLLLNAYEQGKLSYPMIKK